MRSDIPPSTPAAPHSPADTAPDEYWRALLHRWFVTYNPFYLVSALLVLVGLHLVSSGLAHEKGLVGPIGVAVLAEAYSGALIASAAFLARRGQKRPAVLLGLLALLYQVDLTLHTETCAAMGAVGAAFAFPWVVIFGGKLVAIARALHVRLSRRTLATALLGAVGLAGLPFVLVFAPRDVIPARGFIVATFVFALGAIAPRNLDDMVVPTRPLDAWGRTVLRRVTVATSVLFVSALAGHVYFVWSTVTMSPILLALFALFVARRESEKTVWIMHGLLLAVTLLVCPGALSMVAAFVGFSLILRAFSRLRTFTTQVVESSGAPRAAYRTPEADEDPVRQAAWQPMLPMERLERVVSEQRARLLAGALSSTYLALWTLSWRGGPLPSHVLVLDLAYAAGLLALVYRMRPALPGLVPGSACLVHGLVVSELVPMPKSPLAWGTVALSSGFALLFASVATSSWLAKKRPPVA